MSYTEQKVRYRKGQKRHVEKSKGNGRIAIEIPISTGGEEPKPDLAEPKNAQEEQKPDLAEPKNAQGCFVSSEKRRGKTRSPSTYRKKIGRR